MAGRIIRPILFGVEMEKEFCKCCGASLKKYRHSLNKGLGIGLLKLYRAGGTAMLRELQLTTVQFNNFQKLQYWGLVKRLKDSHEWDITPIGRSFVEGKISVPKVVITFRSEVEGHEAPKISISDLMSDTKYKEYWWREEYLENSL